LPLSPPLARDTHWDRSGRFYGPRVRVPHPDQSSGTYNFPPAPLPPTYSPTPNFDPQPNVFFNGRGLLHFFNCLSLFLSGTPICPPPQRLPLYPLTLHWFPPCFLHRPSPSLPFPCLHTTSPPPPICCVEPPKCQFCLPCFLRKHALTCELFLTKATPHHQFCRCRFSSLGHLNLRNPPTYFFQNPPPVS